MNDAKANGLIVKCAGCLVAILGRERVRSMPRDVLIKFCVEGLNEANSGLSNEAGELVYALAFAMADDAANEVGKLQATN